MYKKWKPIPGYSNYKVSNFGEVKSLKRKFDSDKFHRISKEFILQANFNRSKTMYVNMTDDNGKRNTVSISRLVMLIFHEHDGKYTRRDGDYKNNRADNLIPIV